MKTVLAFGDSNTRGYIAGGAGRYPRMQRWSYLLEQLLAPGVQVIEEGLNGRTTVFDEVVRNHRSGASALPMLLETHAPLDVVVIMLGTNDMKLAHQATAEMSADGMERLVRVVKGSEAGPDGGVPKILVVAPAPFGEHLAPDPTDGVHLDADGHRKLATALAPVLIRLLR